MVLIQNLGAEKGFILLERNSVWYIGLGASTINPNINRMQFIPIEKIGKKDDNTVISRSIVSYVITKRETIVLHNAAEEDAFMNDPYIKNHSPKSIYCTPLVHEDNLRGVLYMENNSIPGIFNADRIELINMHTFQLAILLENIEIYQALEKLKRTLERKVSQRTKEVEKQLDEIATQKDEIMAQRDLVTKQKDQIVEQKQAMTDSIYYASRIQSALLPLDEDLDSLLPSYFILNKPRDIVSGDYYWVSHKDNKVIVAVADCTGHGVPGAFMSILGIAFLNEIINTSETIIANEILNELREHIIKSLHQTGRKDETRDGMEMALCVVDFGNKKLQYSGAMRPLYLIRNTELKVFKGDYMPIGVHEEDENSFSNIELHFKEDDIIYLFSDGYVSQIGGPERKTFRSRKLKQLLINIHHKPLHEQKEIMEKEYEQWSKDIEQIDDITVMGIKFTKV
jgi:serine phosphatase RsbU (regulator of sigma subunit)